MSIRNENGTLKTYKGDTFKMTFNIKGLIPVSLYNIYLQVNFPEPVIKQVEATTDQEGFYKAVFEVSCHESDVLPRKYTFGVKACRNGCEDTIYTGCLEVQNKFVEGV